jgi:hypothetical protein
MTAAVQETELRERIRTANAAIPDWSWTVDELSAFAGFLESVVANRRLVDTVGNVAWLADRR